MSIAPSKRGRKKGGKVRFPGLLADAKSLCVSPEHLWRVLIGERQSKRLVADYHALKARQTQKAA